MGESKHTPGPWRVEERRSSAVMITVQGPDVEVCKHRPGRGIEQGEARANARLIAAAPELLAALIYARNLIGPDEIIDAALAKAGASHV